MTSDLLGHEIAARLSSSPVRPLFLQLDAASEALPWETSRLGARCLGECFQVARQLPSEADPSSVQSSTADMLAVTVVGASRLREWPHSVACPADSIPHCRPQIAAAHVLVLHDLSLTALLRAAALPLAGRLLIVGPEEDTSLLAMALDTGAAVLCAPPGGLPEAPMNTLLWLLDTGVTVGEAVRRLRAAPVAANDLRLYGDPSLRFMPDRSEDSRRQVTSLSFDLIDSTQAIDRLGDETYAERLSRLHRRCTELIRRQGGLAGEARANDGTMSFFGHPQALEDAAQRAVKAALDIARAAAEFGFAVRVGVATGDVAVRDGLPHGMSVHHAARLQKHGAPGKVLVADSTRALVVHAFELQEVILPAPMPGISPAEGVHQVLGPRADAEGHAVRGRPPRLTPLVGRDEELALLDARVSELRPGKRRLVMVQGDAGIGKSRLVREFRNRWMARGVPVLECRCRQDASASPYLALAEALRRWMGIGGLESGAVARDKLKAALPPQYQGEEPLALLGTVLGLSAPPHAVQSNRLRPRIIELLLAWFDAFAQDQPCCLVVEDWHWVDPSLHEFGEKLLHRGAGPGLLVVVTSRGAIELGHTQDEVGPLTVERIELCGLPPQAARELVARVCEDAPLPDSSVRALAERGDGVPLFLEEATRMAQGMGPARQRGRRDLLADVPASLSDLLTARLDEVREARPTANAAAVLGREFSFDQLVLLADTPPLCLNAAALAEQLALLERAGLVRQDGFGRCTFKHALVRDAAYASMWDRDRRALHARMVQLLTKHWIDLAARQPELLAHHQTEAGLHVQALVQWERAAQSAAQRSAEFEAISHLRRAISLLEHVADEDERRCTALRLQLMLAARLIATQGYGADAVAQAYHEAQRLCAHLGDPRAHFKVEMGLQAYHFMRAEFARSLEHGQRAAAIAQHSGDPKERLQAHWGLACTLFHQGALPGAMHELDRGLALYHPGLHRRFGVQDPGVMCLAYSSWCLWELARPDAAVARIQHAITIAGQLEHKFSQAVALAYGVGIHWLRGEPAAALSLAQRCLALCEDGGFPVWLAITRCMRGRLLCGEGRFDAGLAEMHDGYVLWMSTGSRVSQPLYRVLQAEGFMQAGDDDAARRCVHDGLDAVERYGERQLEAELLRLRGELAQRNGDQTAAAELLHRAHALAIRQHRLGFALRSATSLARLWVEHGHTERARGLLTPLLAHWHEGLETEDLRRARALCAELEGGDHHEHTEF